MVMRFLQLRCHLAPAARQAQAQLHRALLSQRRQRSPCGQADGFRCNPELLKSECRPGPAPHQRFLSRRLHRRRVEAQDPKSFALLAQTAPVWRRWPRSRNLTSRALRSLPSRRPSSYHAAPQFHRRQCRRLQCFRLQCHRREPSSVKGCCRRLHLYPWATRGARRQGHGPSQGQHARLKPTCKSHLHPSQGIGDGMQPLHLLSSAGASPHTSRASRPRHRIPRPRH